jgi:hypothetical protein
VRPMDKGCRLPRGRHASTASNLFQLHQHTVIVFGVQEHNLQWQRQKGFLSALVEIPALHAQLACIISRAQQLGAQQLAHPLLGKATAACKPL